MFMATLTVAVSVVSELQILLNWLDQGILSHCIICDDCAFNCYTDESHMFTMVINTAPDPLQTFASCTLLVRATLLRNFETAQH